MDDAAPICSAALMCHAPIVLPEVAGPRSTECTRTTAAMREAGASLAASSPDALVVVSPHTPRPRRAFGMVAVGIDGSFARFGAPHVRVELPGAPAAGVALADAAAGQGVQVVDIDVDDLDHGAAVPLHFVIEAGFAGPTLLLSLAWDTRDDDCVALGRAIADAARASEQRWALLASGDMSHRLIEGAPSGFHPDGARFDDAVVKALRSLDLDGALGVDPRLREHAAEDVLESVAVARGALGTGARGGRFLSYEGPFGVGYLVAVLHDEGDGSSGQPARREGA